MAEGFSHPYDTPVSGGLRFAVELIAWIAAPWAVAQEAWWLAVPVFVVLVGLPAVFSTPGDKRQVVVATPGPVRVAIEALLYAAAIAGAWLVWPVWAAVVATGIVLISLVAGRARLAWLLRGAPS
jgi:hypothetical protein